MILNQLPNTKNIVKAKTYHGLMLELWRKILTSDPTLSRITADTAGVESNPF